MVDIIQTKYATVIAICKNASRYPNPPKTSNQPVVGIVIRISQNTPEAIFMAVVFTIIYINYLIPFMFRGNEKLEPY